MTNMNAVGFTQSLPIDDARSLIDFTTLRPDPGPHDLLVRVRAVSLNPVDAKVRKRAALEPLPQPRILGYDAVGVVETVGGEVAGFKPGDDVYYAGDITRPGSNAQYQLVDARIAAIKPETLNDAQAAVLPLTSLTAWEALFNRLHIAEGSGEGKSLLIIGGAGGVGSIAIQIARKLTNLRVIATASRPQSVDWCISMGAHDTADHRDLVASVRSLGISHVDYIFNVSDTALHWDAMLELIAPQGSIAAIVEGGAPLNMARMHEKSITLAWELMFTRAMFQTADMAEQGKILRRIASLADRGVIRSTLTQTLQGLNAETLKRAHALLETGQMIGKVAVSF